MKIATPHAKAVQVVSDLYLLAYCVANNLTFRPDAGALLRAAGGRDAVLEALSGAVVRNEDGSYE